MRANRIKLYNISMDIIKITRISDKDGCIRGVYTYNDEPFGVTLELPYLDNERNISAIPEGKYRGRVIPHETRTTGGLGKLIKLEDVPGRDGILIHVGNTVLDTQGCILVGKYFGRILNKPAVMESREAFFKLMQAIHESTVYVDVKGFGQIAKEQEMKKVLAKKPEIKNDVKSFLDGVIGSGVNRRRSTGK